MKCKCKYFLMDEYGIRRCTQCNEPANKVVIEDKTITKHGTKKRRKRTS